MKSKLLVMVAILLTVCVPIFAHHGTPGSYDQNKVTTLKGTVTSFVWSNPHCQLYFDVKDEAGNVAHWGGETNSPSVLLKAGWSRNIMKPGDEITISVNPSLAGAPVGEILKIVLPDGKVLFRGNGQVPESLR
jgi:hypothetical protein